MSKYKINHELAEEEFEKFCEAWEIEDDIQAMTEDDQAGFESQKSKFIRAVKLGRLSLNDDETLTYIFSDKKPDLAGKEIIIKRPEGSSYMEMDGYKDNQPIKRTYSVLAAMTGKTVRYFSNIDGVDLKALQSVITLFLAG